MGHTLEKPTAHVRYVGCSGQLQLQSQSPLPSGQSHLQEHCIPSSVGVVGSDPDPDPVGGVDPDPDPVGGMDPDPDPVGGTEPEPDPVSGMEPDPDPVGGAVTVGTNSPLERTTFPFVTFIEKENSPDSPSILTDLATPEHFLSHLPDEAEVILVPSAYRVKLQVQVFLPTLTFLFLKTSYGYNVLLLYSTRPYSQQRPILQKEQE